MNIIVAGCGNVGSTVLSDLVNEGHDIIAIDQSADVLSQITNIHDVMCICGNCADNDILIEAGVDKCDLFISLTDSDELNMLSCFIARKLGAKNTVARIRKPEYNDNSLLFFRKQLELSMAVNPEMLAAHEILNLLKFPTAAKIERFSRKNFEMVEIILKPDSPLHGIKLCDLRAKYNAKVLICCVQRGDEVFIPDGNFVLQGEDRIGITATPEEIHKFMRSLGTLQKQARNVMILGGSRTSHYLADMLTNIGCQVKIIERDPKTAEELCDALPEAVVICGDGAEQEILVEEGLRSLDAFVSLTGSDEQNILTSIFAKSQNLPKVITKINRDELSLMALNLGLDSIISPKNIVSDLIVSFARAKQNSRGSNVETLYKLMDGEVEAVEFNVKDDPKIVDIPIKDLSLHPDILIAGIIRDKKPIIPGGNDRIISKDRVVVISAKQRLSDLSDIIV